MAKKITIQHYYTTGTTAAPAADNLILGEIAISAGEGHEGIYFKNNADDVVKVLTSGQTYELVEKATSGITSDLTFKTHKETRANEYSDANKNDANKYGHVLLHNGDLSEVTPDLGLAAGIGHTHGQYLTNVTPGSGQPIVSIIENGVATIGLTSGITNQISSGVTAYGWGNHADAGYAKNNDLASHTGNTTMHITEDERTKWNSTTTKFDAFISGDTNEALDTLVEIQEFLSGDTTGSVNLISKVNKNTSDISTLSGNVTTNTNNFNTLGERVSALERDQISSISGGTENISVSSNNVGKGKEYLIKHTTASTPSDALRTINNSSALTFGDEFNIINNISYDANGHIVSGSTQTLKLPSLVTANTENYGIVRIRKGDLNGQETNMTEGLVAHVSHYHSQYAKLTDLDSYAKSTDLESYIKLTDLSSNTGDTITISCGTY